MTAGEAVKVYLLLFAGALIVIAVEVVLAGWLGGEASRQAALSNLRVETPLIFLGLFLMAAMFDTGGLLEELGWRGYAFPLLQKAMATPLHAAILIGVLWALWHFPRDVPYLLAGQAWSTFLAGQVIYMIGPVASSIIIAWFFNRTGGSVIPAILLHGLSNFMGDTTESQELFLRFSTHEAIRVAVALLIISLAGPQLGRRSAS